MRVIRVCVSSCRGSMQKVEDGSAQPLLGKVWQSMKGGGLAQFCCLCVGGWVWRLC